MVTYFSGLRGNGGDILSRFRRVGKKIWGPFGPHIVFGEGCSNSNLLFEFWVSFQADFCNIETFLLLLWCAADTNCKLQDDP